jgi:dihydrofolate reductase
MNELKFNIILATDSNNGISKDGKIPWHYPDDMKFFNRTTTSFDKDDKENEIVRNVCIMGAKTALDLKTGLKNRHNIVISSKGAYWGDFKQEFTLEAGLERARNMSYPGKEIFVCGGSRLYNEALKHPNLDKIYYTHINKSYDTDNFVDPILNRDDMVYDVLNKILVNGVELTFYLIIPKKRFETHYQVLTYNLKIKDELFSDIKSGNKTYEVLGCRMSLRHILSTVKRNDIIEYTTDALETVKVKISEVTRFKTFEEALNQVDFKKIYPNMSSKELALTEFNDTFSASQQRANGGVFIIKFNLNL